MPIANGDYPFPVNAPHTVNGDFQTLTVKLLKLLY
jgi:hypothetical protein